VFPSLNDLAFLLPIFLLFSRLNGTQLLFSDGDTGWHIRTGEWILAHHAVPTVDLFSFTKSNQPWFAWEWVWDIAFAAIHSCTGLAGVAFVNTLLLGVFTLLVYRLSLMVSQNHLTSMLVTALAAGASSLHWLARPHLVTWILVLVFFQLLERCRVAGPSATALQIRVLFLPPLLMMLWVNVHGGFVAGLLMIAGYALGETLTSLVETNFHWASAWRSSACYWQSLVLCAAATFVNPYGWKLHSHIFTYLTDWELLDKIQEFQSISFHAAPAILFEIMLMLATFVVLTNLQKRQFTPVLLLCLWAHYALLSARHIPIFMLVAAPFVAQLLSVAVREASRIPALAVCAQAIADISTDLGALESTPRLHLLSAASLLIVAGLFAAGQAPFAPQFNTDAFPVQAIPTLEQHRGSRLFTTDQWADYVLYRMYPAQRVFFDGRSDFYGIEFVKVNQAISSAEHNWKSLLKRYGIELVLLKPEAPLSSVLKLTPGSKVLFDDGKVIVFDITAIYQPGAAGSNRAATQRSDMRRLLPSSGRFETANRVASSSSIPRFGLKPAAATINRSIQSQKGKTS